jgi:anion-transporting  ArsA/GET3 family ATPase
MEPSDLRIVTGKGGVGKTTVATALALAAVKAGKKVLLCELHGGNKVAHLLQIAPVGPHIREVFEDLFVVDIDPQEALHEYVLIILHFEALYKTLFDNRVVKSFLNLVPSLGELVMLGKIWYHTQEVVHDRRRFDLIVVDAPATGHTQALLEAPQAVAKSVPPGPMRDNAARIGAMLTRPQQTQLLVVSTAEDMPVTEALQLQAAAKTYGMHAGMLFINAWQTPLTAAAQAALPKLTGAILSGPQPSAVTELSGVDDDGPQQVSVTEPAGVAGLRPLQSTLAALPEATDLRPLQAALQRRVERNNAAAAELQRFDAETRKRTLTLPFLPHEPFGRAALETLAAHMLPHVLRGDL